MTFRNSNNAEKMNSCAKMTATAITGFVMLLGTRGMEKDTVTVTITNPANKIVKVGGAFSGKHSAPSYYTLKGAKMSGSGKGSVSAKSDGSFSGTAGKKPSHSVGDTKVQITYKNQKEKDITGEDSLTVVEVITSGDGSAYVGDVVTPNGTIWYYAVISFVETAKPIGLGQVTLTATPSKGKWSPNPVVTSSAPGTFAGLATTDYLLANINPVSIFVSFELSASYAGIKSNTAQEILVNQQH